MKKWHITLIIGIIGTLLLIIIFILINNVTFKLNGNVNEIIEVGTNYQDKGFTATIFRKDISNKVKINNNIDNNKIGNYKITYNLQIFEKKYNLIRKIKVIDDIKPEIKLNGESEINIYINEKYEDEGATAIDNYDGDITSNIVVNNQIDNTKEGEYTIIYTIKDSSNNENNISRKVIVKKKTETIKNNPYDNYNQNYDINNPIIKYIKDNNYKVSIGYYNLVTGDSLYYQENKLYYGASLIKTLDALYLYDKNLVTENIKPYIEKAISVSDNDSHYQLINYIGKNNLRNYGISLGAQYTLSGGDLYGSTTVKDQIVYFKKLYELAKNEELKSYFINNYGNYLKINNIEVMHKYGYYGSYYHDVGIFLDEEPYILVVLTKHGSNNEKEVINNISKKVYEYHNK